MCSKIIQFLHFGHTQGFFLLFQSLLLILLHSLCGFFLAIPIFITYSATFPVVPLSTFCYIPCGTTLHILLHSLWYHSPHSATFPVVPLSTFCYIPCGTTLHIHHSIPYHDLFRLSTATINWYLLSVKS